jgi:hypothetical protein
MPSCWLNYHRMNIFGENITIIVWPVKKKIKFMLWMSQDEVFSNFKCIPRNALQRSAMKQKTCVYGNFHDFILINHFSSDVLCQLGQFFFSDSYFFFRKIDVCH